MGIYETFHIKGLSYTVRQAVETDAEQLEKIRLKVDGETEHLDREPGEDYLDHESFKAIIKDDLEKTNHLFLLAESNGEVIAYSRCAGSHLKRLAHKVEFGIGVLKDYWGYKVGHHLLAASMQWADDHNIKKVTLTVLERNESAVRLYERHGFQTEGVLRNDKFLSDGNYHASFVMGRIKS
ncbi:GNAT family N-acetyltransferase [Halobacillus litoralis]|uniref:GNAT family N-acetyltransferase n=1 Tax=Halobacillus litoralis TaxID=45668 RepID=UPI001CD2D18C|nr:GNAT family N-acetyltransferase [Halobacillus litoralis]MCA0972853.1 GNAT family N-acetyltransferase [Halobacillus litoralis]